jgi:hypothetical protein
MAEAVIGRVVEAGAEVANAAAILAIPGTIRLVNAMRAAAPGASLVVLDIAPSSFSVPITGRSVTTGHDNVLTKNEGSAGALDFPVNLSTQMQVMANCGSCADG